MKNEDISTNYIHEAEIKLVVFQHIVHSALVFREEHLGLHLAGKRVYRRAFNIKSPEKVCNAVGKALFQLGMGIDEKLNAGNSVDRKVIKCFLKRFWIQASCRNTCYQSYPSLRRLIQNKTKNKLKIFKTVL